MALSPSYRTSAALLVSGEVVFIGAGLNHPAHEVANNHPAVFAEYASSDIWTSVHAGQFVGIALIVGGLLCLCFAVEARAPKPVLSARLAAIGAAVTLALYGVLQAVDGVALKHAVDTWQQTGGSVDNASFGDAQTVRFLEWGIRSYEQFAQGLTLVLVAIVIATRISVSRVIAYSAGIAGAAYIAQGAIIGNDGFSSTSGHVGMIALLFDLAWIIGFALSTRRADAATTGIPVLVQSDVAR